MTNKTFRAWEKFAFIAVMCFCATFFRLREFKGLRMQRVSLRENKSYSIKRSILSGATLKINSSSFIFIALYLLLLFEGEVYLLHLYSMLNQDYFGLFSSFREYE